MVKSGGSDVLYVVCMYVDGYVYVYGKDGRIMNTHEKMMKKTKKNQQEK